MSKDLSVVCSCGRHHDISTRVTGDMVLCLCGKWHYIHHGPRLRTPQIEATLWARRVLSDPSVVILDTETTGLGEKDEVVQVAVIDLSGTVLFNTLVEPSISIPAQASAIHHITNEMVTDAPTFLDVAFDLFKVLIGRAVVIYNAPFDQRLLRQSCNVVGLSYLSLVAGVQRFEDVMLPYSQYVGDWNEYHQNYRWQKLPGGDHTALGDCRATLDVLRLMAKGGAQ